MPEKFLMTPLRACAYIPLMSRDSQTSSGVSTKTSTKRVARLADVERRVDEDFDEAFAADHVADAVARRAIGAHRRADDGAAMTHDLRGDESDAEDVRVAVFFRESESFR